MEDVTREVGAACVMAVNPPASAPETISANSSWLDW
jgi:hypothetical protein